MTSSASSPPQRINFQGGWPSTRLHPVEALAEASQQVLLQGQDSCDLLIYGHELGHYPVREHVASWLTEFYNPAAGPISTDRIAISNGASNSLSTILQKFTDPVYTRRIWLVEPTYFLACPIFADAGFGGRMSGLPEDDEGIDLNYARKALQKADEDALAQNESTPVRKTTETGYPKLYRHVIYAVPTMSNPSAKTMSLHHRIELVKIAREFDALLITDDVYDFLRWPEEEHVAIDALGPIPPRLVDIDRQLEGTSTFGNAVSNGSFSKIVAPAMRVGWCEGTPQFSLHLSKVGATVSGGCQSRFSSLLIDNLITSGYLNKHIRETLIPTLRQRYFSMIRAIKEDLYPLGIRITTGKSYETMSTNSEFSKKPLHFAGGFFLYISFPDDGSLPPAAEIARIADTEYSLLIAPGSIFTVTGDPSSMERAKQSFGQGARLCWAWHEEDVLLEGIQRLAQVVQDLRAR